MALDKGAVLVEAKDDSMDAVLTVRLGRDVKEKATSILKARNLTPSAAVQRYFDVIVETGDVPFGREKPKPTLEEITRRLEAMRRFRTSKPLNMTDEEIRAARIKERYDIDLG